MLPYGRRSTAALEIVAEAGCILGEVVMLRKTVVVLAIALVLVGPALSTSAFARGGEGRIAGGGDGDYRGRASALRGGFHRYGRHDVWGHWGSYYGPTVSPM
jgi:hypothetical protein